MKHTSNNIVNFPRQSIQNSVKNINSVNFSRYDIIESKNGSGGGDMPYITREEFNSKIEVIDVKLEKLEDKLDSTAKLILSETKNYILESSKEQRNEITENRKWTIGAVLIPSIIAIVSIFINIYF